MLMYSKICYLCWKPHLFCQGVQDDNLLQVVRSKISLSYMVDNIQGVAAVRNEECHMLLQCLVCAGSARL